MHPSLQFLLFVFWKLSVVNPSSIDDLAIDDFWKPNEEDTSSPLGFLGEPDLFSSDVASTDCAAQLNPMDELSLMPRDNDDSSCGLPLPLSADTLQLFQDPLNSLEQILPTGKDIPETVDPGQVTPEEEEEEETGVVAQEEDPGPCGPFLLTGHIHHICCQNVLGEYPNWRMGWDCRWRFGKFNSLKEIGEHAYIRS